MHQPIKDGLEEYLRDPGKGTNSREFDAHLAACSSCAQELRLLEAQTLWLRLLQDSPAASAEPGPGFYARFRTADRRGIRRPGAGAGHVSGLHRTR